MSHEQMVRNIIAEYDRARVAQRDAGAGAPRREITVIRNGYQRDCKHAYGEPRKSTDLFVKCPKCGHRASLERVNKPAYVQAQGLRKDGSK